MKIILLLTLALLLSACQEETIRGDFQIESPLQNICQSADLLKDFPKCPD